MTNFDQIYWAHQPPDVRALPSIPDPDQRSARAAQLAAKNFVIDVPIMVWLWDAEKVMELRKSYGYTWVPSALMPPIQIAPGLGMPNGTPPYDPKNPPPGAILVSTDPKDYPPFKVPSTATANSGASAAGTPAPAAVVGQAILGMPNMYYALGAATQWPDGSTATDTRGTFTLHRVHTPFADSVWFVKTA